MLPWQYYGFVGMISTKQWNAYPDWAKKVITDAAAEAEQYHRKIWEVEDGKARDAYVKAGGAIHEIRPEQRAEWVKLGRGMWPRSGVSQADITAVRAAIGAK